MPAANLRAIGKIGVFGERVVLPAACVFDSAPAPDARGAVEIEKESAAIARAMLDDEMAVEQNRFHFGERGIVPVDVAPARLHHGELRIREIRDGAAEKIGGRNKIGVEDGDVFSARGFQPFLQRSGLETLAIVAMNVADGNAECLVAFDAIASDFLRFVGRIVEHLNIEQLARVIELRNAFDEALDHVALVVDRKLDGDARPLSDFRRRPRDIFSMLEIIVNERVAMDAVGRENHHHQEIRQHDGHIESVRLIEAGEGAVGKPVPVIGQRAGRREEPSRK